uniref:MSP domain-containing protein n=1 Tax=Loa loa TaxID=7209 RepID=A0A1I7VLA2_LOALO
MTPVVERHFDHAELTQVVIFRIRLPSEAIVDPRRRPNWAVDHSKPALAVEARLCYWTPTSSA